MLNAQTPCLVVFNAVIMIHVVSADAATRIGGQDVGGRRGRIQRVDRDVDVFDQEEWQVAGKSLLHAISPLIQVYPESGSNHRVMLPRRFPCYAQARSNAVVVGL